MGKLNKEFQKSATETKKYNLKGTVRVISSEPPCKDCNGSLESFVCYSLNKISMFLFL